MKKRSQFIKKSGLLMGAVLVCMSFPDRITWAEESNEITADQAEERKERILTSYLAANHCPAEYHQYPGGRR